MYIHTEIDIYCIFFKWWDSMYKGIREILTNKCSNIYYHVNNSAMSKNYTSYSEEVTFLKIQITKIGQFMA